MTALYQRILLTGASGQVGGDLRPLLEPFGSVTAPTRAELDWADGRELRRLIHEIKLEGIISLAAYTAVDKAESEPQAAYAINAEAPRAIGQAAAELEIPVIHFSTDYVYDGSGMRPWTESDPTGPLGVYGASKLAGEQALCGQRSRAPCFSNQLGLRQPGQEFPSNDSSSRAGKGGTAYRGRSQHGAPTWSRDLARSGGACDETDSGA